VHNLIKRRGEWKRNRGAKPLSCLRSGLLSERWTNCQWWPEGNGRTVDDGTRRSPTRRLSLARTIVIPSILDRGSALARVQL